MRLTKQNLPRGILVVLLVSGCSYEPVKPIVRSAIPENETDCAAQGGTWGGLGLRVSGVCVLPTTDGGKKCSDSSECQGACVTTSNVSSGTRVTGVCTHKRPVAGALTYVVDGRAEIIIAE